jgi:DNA polymerase III subunit alpha
MNALYRPGPMQWIEDFINRKHGRRNIEYLHEKTKNALENTYGILVYQEQVMQIAKDLCGFTGGQADTLRKGVAKKKPEVLAALKKDFIDGALDNSDINRQKIEEFWRSLEAFAAYCFPKAHSSCYATIAYWTAYLKAHYPSAFMAALMTSDYDNTDRLAIEITECKHMGLDVLPPDINESFVEFAVVPNSDQVRFGLAAIKNVGTGAVEEILRARAENGPFESLEAFFMAVNTRVVNRKALESLIKAGAFDRFGHRSYLLHNLDVLLAYAARVQKDLSSGQTDLFGNLVEGQADLRPQLILEDTIEAYSTREQLAWERELLGLYLSQHPLKQFEIILSEQSIPLNSLTAEHDNASVTVGGAIQDIREITTKNGQKMGFVKIADQFSELELILFPNIYQQTTEIWQRDRIILAKGKVTARDKNGNTIQEVKILVNEANEITPDEAAAFVPGGKKPKLPKTRSTKVTAPASVELAIPTIPAAQRIYIRLAHSNDEQTLMSLRNTINQYQGNTEVVLVVGPPETKQIIRLPMRVSANEETMSTFSSLVGSDNVALH